MDDFTNSNSTQNVLVTYFLPAIVARYKVYCTIFAYEEEENGFLIKQFFIFDL